MQTYLAVKLHFTAPLILTRGKEQNLTDIFDLLHSDTLASALFVSALQLMNVPTESFDKSAEFETLLKEFRNLTISSAFPFWKDEYFFPKPMVKLPFSFTKANALDSDTKQNKQLKKIQFLGKSIFEQVISGSTASSGNSTIEYNAKLTLSDNGKYISEKIAVAKSNQETFRINTRETKNQIVVTHSFTGDDFSRETTPYDIERLHFTDNSGLFFLINVQKEMQLPSWFLPALQLLADEGIGGYRSSGNGKFSFSIEKLTLSVPDNANCQMNLSVFCPDEKEVTPDFLGNENSPGGWNLMQTGGWLTQDVRSDGRALRKCPVYCFVEGSVFQSKDENGNVIKAVGSVVDLKPTETTIHAYRNCRSIFIPIQCNPTAESNG